jgi:hypothetical protein
MINKFIFTLTISLCFAQTAVATSFSSKTNGVYLAFGAIRHGLNLITNEPIRFDDQLVWGAFCDTGKVELSCPDSRYSLKIKLTDTNGVELAKTKRGEVFGARFDQLRKITDSKVTPVLAWGPFQNDSLGRLFPTPAELFQIEKPGIYTLEIQMQMFRYVPSYDPVERSKTLFRFSPIKIKVEKPPNAKTNSSLNTQTNPPAK